MTYSAPMRPAGRTLLLAGLIAVAVLVLHELRYLIGYGGHAGQALAEQGHGYLPLAGIGVLLLLALGVGQLLLAFRHALRSATASPAPPFGLLWLAAISALLTIYCSQELIEGMLATGHPAGFGALAADGGWSALPLAIGLGALVALALRGAAAVERRAAARARAPRSLPARAPRVSHPRPAVAAAPRSVLALKLAGRGPPRALLTS
ncbi:MAG TPA: hypothetical protein VI111_08385 [Thermoleophilaceae bacterium]